MQWENLPQIDTHLEVLKVPSFAEDILGPRDLDNFTDFSFVFVNEKKFFSKLLENLNDSCQYKGLIIASSLWEQADKKELLAAFGFLALSRKPNTSLSLLSRYYYQQQLKNEDNINDAREGGECSIDASAQVAKSAFIGKNVIIEKNVVIYAGVTIMSNSTIGAGSEIFPGVTIYHNVVIGKNCRIHASCVIGADGYGYNFEDGIHQKVWHLGGVIIEDDVEIGAESAVDAGTFRPTIIGSGSKFDNHVQVAHNVKIGKGCLLCGHVAIAGSCVVGDYCVFGGMSCISNGKTLGAASQVGGCAVITNDFPESNNKLGGHPARPIREWLRGVAYLRKNSLK